MEEARGPGAPVGNSNRLTFGHERAVNALAKGRPLRGLAKEIAEETAIRLYTDGGPGDLMLDGLARHLAVARLFFDLLIKEPDRASLDRWYDRFSWLNSRAHRMALDAIERGIGNRAALVEEVRRATVDQVVAAALAYGLTIGDPDAITASDWAKRFGRTNDKAHLMLRSLADLERQADGGEIVDYEDLLAAERAG